MGFFNLFREECAIDFWVLDLADVEQARVLQELIFLGDEETGRNFVEVTYNEKDFQVPSGWLKQVPRNGIISLHYCREKTTCRRIEKNFIAGQWPTGYRERHGLDWVKHQRLKTIKAKVASPPARNAVPCTSIPPESLDADSLDLVSSRMGPEGVCCTCRLSHSLCEMSNERACPLPCPRAKVKERRRI